MFGGGACWICPSSVFSDVLSLSAFRGSPDQMLYIDHAAGSHASCECLLGPFLQECESGLRYQSRARRNQRQVVLCDVSVLAAVCSAIYETPPAFVGSGASTSLWSMFLVGLFGSTWIDSATSSAPKQARSVSGMHRCWSAGPPSTCAVVVVESCNAPCPDLTLHLLGTRDVWCRCLRSHRLHLSRDPSLLQKVWRPIIEPSCGPSVPPMEGLASITPARRRIGLLIRATGIPMLASRALPTVCIGVDDVLQARLGHLGCWSVEILVQG